MRDKGGKFSKGNPGGALKKPVDDDILALRNRGNRELTRLFDMYGNMPLAQLKSFMTEEAQTRLNGKHAAMIKFWSKLLSDGDVQRMKLMLNMYGIVTDLKAIAVQDLDGVLKKQNESDDEKIDLTKEEKLLMLEKAKSIIIESDD